MSRPGRSKGAFQPIHDAGPVEDLWERVSAVYGRATPLDGPMLGNWESFWRSAPNPLAPTVEEARRQTLTPSEIDRYVQHFRPLVERGVGVTRRAAAYLTATRAAP